MLSFPVMLLTLTLLLGGSWLVFYDPGRRRVRRRLRALASGGYTSPTPGIASVRRTPQVLSDIPWFHRFLVSISLRHPLERFLAQANSPYPLGLFVLLSLFLGCAGFLAAWLLGVNVLAPWFGAIVLGLTPFLFLSYRKTQRMRKFAQQLPEALDLVARSLQVGQPFLVGMQMVGDEFSDPLGTEFTKTVDEINFGVGVPEALTSLARRIDCVDLLFVVTAVLVQREVGGNLAEILAKTSQLIRQRFELQGRIKVLAAEGKFSAVILFTMPFALGLLIHWLNPEYLTVLFTDPVGKMMLGYAGGLMLLGALVVKKMIRIRV